ncbi:MAG: TolC family protein [Marinifilaceae bacterium]
MKRYSCVFIILLATLNGYTQIQLTRETCTKLALEHSKTLKIASEEQQQATYNYRAYRAKYFPGIFGKGLGIYNQNKSKYSIDGGYLPTYITNADGKLIPNVISGAHDANGQPVFAEYAFLPDIELELNLRTVYDIGVELQQPLYMGGKIRNAVQAAGIGENIAAQRTDYNRAEVLFETEQAFVHWIEAGEMIKVAQDYVSLVEQLHKEVAEATRVGLAMKNQLYQIDVKKNEAALMLQQAQHATTLASMNLCRIMGLDLYTQIQTKDTLNATCNPMVWQLDSTPTQRPEYIILEENIKLKEKEINIARADYLPQLGVSAGYYYSGGIKLNGSDNNAGSVRAMASLSIPIYQWSEGRNKVRIAQSAKEISSYQLGRMNEMMQLEITASRFNITEALTRLDMVRQTISDANENLRIMQQEYNVGMQTLTNLLDAQLMWQQAQQQWVSAKGKLQIAEIAYKRAVGALGK